MLQFFKNMLVIIVGTVLAWVLLKFVAPLLAPFIAAIFLAFLIEPLVKFLHNRFNLPRGGAVGLAMLVLFGSMGFIVTLAVGRLIVELFHLSTFLPDYINNIKGVVVEIQTRVEAYYLTLPLDVLDFINNKIASSNYSLDAILRKAQVITGAMLNFMLQLVSLVPVWIVLIIISAIATYFMSKDKRLVMNFWMKVIPPPWGRKSLEITKEIFEAIILYIRAQLILISITMVQSLIGLYIIGAPYALLMGLVIGVADLIPVLGPSSIYLPWIIWEFASGDSAFAIKLTIIFGIVLIVRQVLETKIVSSSMGLHPLATMVAMYVGLQLLGALGVIAGPLFLITVKAFASAGIIGWKRTE